MAKSRIHERAFLIFMAVLFLGTAVVTSVAVIWSAVDQSSQNSSNTTAANNAKDLTHLQGTKLAGFTPVSSVASLQATDTRVGSGAAVTASSTLEVIYTGAVAATGKIFQASTDSSPDPVSIQLTNTIKGWQQGLIGMKAGGTRQLIIPANEAYGANPPANSGIPANAALVFNVTVLSVQQ